MKVFLDTNVWLSAIVFPGLCSELLASLHEAGHEVLTSDLVRAETHEVLRRKFPRHEQAIIRFDLLWADGAHVTDVPEPADDADARLVTAALQGGAALFVTGDARVLGWSPKDAMRIVSPRDAWGLLFNVDQF